MPGFVFRLAVVLAAMLASATWVQPAGAQPSAQPPAGSAEPAAPRFTVGMVVKDSAGVVIGPITEIGQTSDGAVALLLNVDGRPIGVLATSLKITPGGDQAISSMTKAQVVASAGPSH
jgi:hypothetical protein